MSIVKLNYEGDGDAWVETAYNPSKPWISQEDRTYYYAAAGTTRGATVLRWNGTDLEQLDYYIPSDPTMAPLWYSSMTEQIGVATKYMTDSVTGDSYDNFQFFFISSAGKVTEGPILDTRNYGNQWLGMAFIDTRNRRLGFYEGTAVSRWDTGSVTGIALYAINDDGTISYSHTDSYTQRLAYNDYGTQFAGFSSNYSTNEIDSVEPPYGERAMFRDGTPPGSDFWEITQSTKVAWTDNTQYPAPMLQLYDYDPVAGWFVPGKSMSVLETSGLSSLSGVSVETAHFAWMFTETGETLPLLRFSTSVPYSGTLQDFYNAHPEYYSSYPTYDSFEAVIIQYYGTPEAFLAVAGGQVYHVCYSDNLASQFTFGPQGSGADYEFPSGVTLYYVYHLATIADGDYILAASITLSSDPNTYITQYFRCSKTEIASAFDLQRARFVRAGN